MCSDILNRIHETLFNDELGCVQGIQARIQVDSEAIPWFCRARTVPFALRDKVELELDRLQKFGVIEPVRLAEWAAPIVPIVKCDGSIRICGDYKVTVN